MLTKTLQSPWIMKCRSNSVSETFIEMQYLWSIYGPTLVGLALILFDKQLKAELNVKT